MIGELINCLSTALTSPKGIPFPFFFCFSHIIGHYLTVELDMFGRGILTVPFIQLLKKRPASRFRSLRNVPVKFRNCSQGENTVKYA